MNAKYLLANALIAVGLACGAAFSGEYALDDLAQMAKSRDRESADMPFYPPPPPSETRYVTVSDGTQLSVSIYFPDAVGKGSDRVPTVFQDSIYGRPADAIINPIALFNAAGFAVVIGDVRGYYTSLGAQNGFNTPRQTRDEADIIAWIAGQNWSDGRVAAFGHSVSGTFADTMTGSGAPALKAAIIRASDFDEYAMNLFPGGIPNAGILALVNEMLDWYRGHPCLSDVAACAELKADPVAGDDSRLEVQRAIVDHQNNISSKAFHDIVFSDDELGAFPIVQSGPIGRIEPIREALVPARVSASWLDGMTAKGALARFAMAPDNPMEVIIGATSHPGGVNADPFDDEPFTIARPPIGEQMAEDVGFLKRVFSGEKIDRSIRYVVLGTDVWKTTRVWPPEGVTYARLYLTPVGLDGTAGPEAFVQHRVDPAVTTGPFNRWASQTGMPIFYGDRRDTDDNRLNFDGKPFEIDTELVGSAKLCLTLSVDTKEANVFAVLEDVGPDGRVTYLTETELNLIHRKSGNEGCTDTHGVIRSFKKADALPLVPGEQMRFEMEFLPVAALVRRGHFLRLSLAGADAGAFAPPSPGDIPTWKLTTGSTTGSRLSVPMRPWLPTTE